jgi:hypothetical protein
MSSDDVFINPLARVLVCSIPFPSPDVVYSAYSTLKELPADRIISLITSDQNFVSNIGNIRTAIDGMDIRGVGSLVTLVIDKNYPELMKQINSSDALFELYRSVIIGLLANIRTEEDQ